MCGPREAAAPRPRVLLFLTAAALIAPRADGLQCRAGWPAAAPPRARRAWTRASMCEDAARRGDARGGRRALLDGLARGAAACGCSLCVQPAPSRAAFERFAEPPAQLREQYDPPRDAASDVALAYGERPPCCSRCCRGRRTAAPEPRLGEGMWAWSCSRARVCGQALHREKSRPGTRPRRAGESAASLTACSSLSRAAPPCSRSGPGACQTPRSTRPCATRT